VRQRRESASLKSTSDVAPVDNGIRARQSAHNAAPRRSGPTRLRLHFFNQQPVAVVISRKSIVAYWPRRRQVNRLAQAARLDIDSTEKINKADRWAWSVFPVREANYAGFLQQYALIRARIAGKGFMQAVLSQPQLNPRLNHEETSALYLGHMTYGI
jgi:hypothetical protein